MSFPSAPRTVHAAAGRPVVRLAAVVLAALSILPTPAHVEEARTAPAPAAAPPGEKLVILSTSDVKGKTSPCGCHIPKGGLSRRAAMADSLRAESPDVLVVDTGGFFPEQAGNEAAATFLAGAMHTLGVHAVGLGDRDLVYGRAFLLETIAGAKLPAVCANLWERRSGRTLVRPWRVERVGRWKVGLFGLMSADVPLGPSQDSLTVSDPVEAARRAVADLRRQGANVVVLLSQLGKIGTEDLVTAVEGIDVAIAGRNVPAIEQGRLIESTAIVYGGEQSQYAGITEVRLDARGRVTWASGSAIALGPTTGENAPMLERVKAFEDAFAAEQRKRAMEKAARDALKSDAAGGGTDHFVGAEVCGRCHASEYAQWKTTPHAKAWASIVAKQAEERDDCVRCHVLGHGEAGGYRGPGDAGRLANVQCESCHGMGTRHDAAGGSMPKPGEAACRTCHDAANSPRFSFASYAPHVLHRQSGALPALPAAASPAGTGADAPPGH